ncbi:MAG: phenylalanine--tRNA ligase subunit beta [Terriglobales bacterium]
MKVLLSWLREFVPVALAPPKLAQRLSLAGLAVERIEPADGDWRLDLDLTSNRPDCLSHYGVAREIAAITGLPLAPLQAPPLPAAEPSARFPVAIEDAQGCGRYCALILENVRVADSPLATAERLQRLGHRAINNIADLTNLTLWEMGHPTHAFDAETLHGGEIRVRRAQPGEKLVTLDEVERQLEPQDLVIADRDRPIALAGVMGGLETAIGPRTRRVVLESAWFDPLSVRRTARRHGLRTDASHRFERGADPEAAPLAAALIAGRARALSATLAGGLNQVEGLLPRREAIPLRVASVKRILGKAIRGATQAQLLRALGCAPQPGGAWLAPSWRPDLTREIDLIEEIARLYGYDRLPSRLPAFAGAAAPLPEAGLRDRVRSQLRGRGFAEALSVSFAVEAECRRFAPQAEPVRVLNPLSEEAAILRTSCLPAMLHQLLHNLHHGVERPQLYEIGKLYALEQGQPRERAVLAVGACGAGLEFSGFKGEIEAVLELFAMPALAWTADPPDFLHPGRSARYGALAVLGQLHPELAAEWKLPTETWLAEVQLARLYALGPRPVSYQPPSRFPASDRDYSFIFADAVSWEAVRTALESPPIAHLHSALPAEIYRGPNLGENHYSLLLRARYQSDARTLRDEEVTASGDELTRRLRALGGVQR